MKSLKTKRGVNWITALIVVVVIAAVIVAVYLINGREPLLSPVTAFDFQKAADNDALTGWITNTEALGPDTRSQLCLQTNQPGSSGCIAKRSNKGVLLGQNANDSMLFWNSVSPGDFIFGTGANNDLIIFFNSLKLQTHTCFSWRFFLVFPEIP